MFYLLFGCTFAALLSICLAFFLLQLLQLKRRRKIHKLENPTERLFLSESSGV